MSRNDASYRRTAAAMLLIAAVIGTCPMRATCAEGGDVAVRLEKSGFTKEQAQRVVAVLEAGQKAGLPAAPLLSRIDEGLAKQVPAGTLTEAVQARLHKLEQAKQILVGSGYADPAAEPAQRLLTATTLALESGLAPDDLQKVLARGQGGFTMRMASIVEAGEAFHLAGLGRESVVALMKDCIDRGLGRMEILRVVRHVVEQHRAGRSDADIRAGLWSASGPTNGAHRGRGPGGRGPR